MRIDRVYGFVEWPTSGRVIPISLLVFALLSFWMAPTGVWGDNEQHYLWLAKQWVGSSDVPENSALLGGMPHAYGFLSIAGAFLEVFGDSGGQALLRILSAAFFAYAIGRLGCSLGLRALEAGLLVILFVLLGQDLFAGEWMFRGVEPKVLAYPCVIIALSNAIERRYLRGSLWLVAASHFHLIIGAMWFGFIFATALLEERRIRPLALPAIAYAIGVLPFILLIFYVYHGTDVTAGDRLPSAQWILAFVRFPNHSSPWNDRSLLASWLPGMFALLAIVTFAFSTSRVIGAGAARWVARLITVSGLYLCLALVVGYFDRGGSVVSLTPFRAESLLLLLCLCLMLVVLREVAGAQRSLLLMPIFATLVAIYLLTAVIKQIGIPIVQYQKQTQRMGAVWTFARDSSPEGSVFLADPAMEREVWSFERRTRRSLLVVTKFVPTRAQDVREWYRRERFRASVFAGGCPVHRDYKIDYLLTSPKDATKFSTCGSLVFSDDNAAVVRLR